MWTHLGHALYFRNLLGCFPVSLFLQGRHFFRFTVRTALKPGNILHVEVQYRLDTYPEGMIERDAIVPFFKWTQLFEFAVSLFCLLSTSQVRSVSTYVCLWKSHFNCQLAKQTVVAITGSETENAQMSNVNCFRIENTFSQQAPTHFFKTR